MCAATRHIPVNLLDTVIAPLVKDNKVDLSDKGNYRPIALMCNMYKILEQVLLVILGSYLEPSPNQLSLKQTIVLYVDRSCYQSI